MSSSVDSGCLLREFYKAKTVLITGATGFLGCTIVEKFLRSFPEIGELFLIVRDKRGKTSKERIEEYFDAEIFDRLKRECPTALSKVRGLHGDVTEVDCGLNTEDLELVIEQVDVVMHGAATVKFTEPLKKAVNINVRGTYHMLNLAKKIKHLQCFLYISTAFSNCNQLVIEETIYPHPIEPTKLMNLTEIMDDELLALITPAILGNWPNIYTYTKNASENLVYTYRHEMPIAIFRPSIIMATLSEPMPCWVNKFFGPYGYMTTTALGLTRVVYCSKSESNSNMVPCDFVANAIIAVAWDVALERKNGLKIINYSSDKNPLTWYDFSVKMMSGYDRAPFSQAIWYPVNYVTSNYLQYKILDILLHKCPAILADISLLLANRKPRYMAQMKSIQRKIDDVKFILVNEISIKTSTIHTIWNKLSEKDRKELPFDIRAVNWDKYFGNAMYGIKRYLIKDDMSDKARHKAKMKYFWLFLVHQLLKHGFLALVIYILRYICRNIKHWLPIFSAAKVVDFY